MKHAGDRITESRFRWYGHVMRMNDRIFLASVLVPEVLEDLEKDG